MGFTIDKDQGKEVEPSYAQQARSPIGPNWLWSVRIAALACCVPPFVFFPFWLHPPLLIYLGFFVFPYVLILRWLVDGRLQRTAFGVALATGLLWAAAALHLCTFDWVDGFELAWWVSVLLTHVALAATAGPAYYRSKRSGEGAPKWSWAITCPVLLAVFVVAGSIDFWYMASDSLRPAPEASAISSVRNLVTSQISYRGTYGSGTYADSLDLLYSSNLIDSVLASGTKDGYTFTVSTDAENDSFAIYVTPITSGGTGTRSFFTDETGVIRYTVADRPAPVEDTPLGQ